MLKAGGLNFGADIDNYYSQSHCCPSSQSLQTLESLKTSQALKSLANSSAPARGVDKQLEQIYTDIATNPGLVIQKDLFTYTRSQLHQGISQVFGDVEPGDEAFDLVQRLRANADRFSGYKSAWQTAHIRNIDPGAELAEAQLSAINSRYNVNWMRTEYVHTVRSARAASNWQDITRDADLYPYLEYMPSTAAEPRGEHKRLYGVIKPINDPFWDTWMPPADWGCRCSVKQMRSDEGAKQPPTDIKLPPATMRNNPGKSGQIFTDQHPMIAKVGAKESKVIDKAILQTLQSAKTLEIEAWIKANIPEQGDFLTLPNFKSNGITILRKNVRGIANHFADPYLKEMANHVRSIVKSAEYFDHAPLKQGLNAAEKAKYLKKKARGVTGYNYYSFKWRDEEYRLNVEVVNEKEFIYAINKIISAG